MWTRTVLKENAKNNLLSGKYWPAFAVSLIALILSGSGRFSVQFRQSWSLSGSDNKTWYDILLPNAALIFAPMLIIGVMFGIALAIFVGNVVRAGSCRWFSRNREAMAVPSVGQTFSLFRSGSYLDTVGSMAWMALFMFLWDLLAVIPYVVGAVFILTDPDFIETIRNMIAINSIEALKAWIQNLKQNYSTIFSLIGLASALLSIPGIIKYYSYRMTPWIIADNPNIGYKRALKLSMEMTRGNKWKMFVLDLSFIGWFLLGVLACGLGVFFVMPYVQATEAELYATLRYNSCAAGLCSMEELGFSAV